MKLVSLQPPAMTETRTSRCNALKAVAAAGLIATTALSGCAGGESVSLPGIGPLETGSLPDPSGIAKGASDQVSEMALVTGVTQEPSRKRLKELFAIDQKCYSIISQDEVWQDVKAERARISAGTSTATATALPPVSNPWTPENKDYYKEHCTPDAQQARSTEMRSLHL